MGDDLVFTFNGYQLWRDPDGFLQVTQFVNGGNVELRPNEEDFGRPLGYYDERMNPVPDPFDEPAA